MTPLRFALVCAAVLATGSACAPPPPSDGATPPPVVDRERLTPEEFENRNFYSAYDAVVALRPIWLNARALEVAVQVYVDDNHLGGVEVLRTIRIASVGTIRHMDGITAGARYGRGHDSGVILVTTLASGRR
jgi:hypothetical protein